MWDGRGATARPREAKPRSGVAAVFWVCYNKNIFKDAFGHHYYQRALYCKDIFISESPGPSFSGVQASPTVFFFCAYVLIWLLVLRVLLFSSTCSFFLRCYFSIFGTLPPSSYPGGYFPVSLFFFCTAVVRTSPTVDSFPPFVYVSYHDLFLLFDFFRACLRQN